MNKNHKSHFIENPNHLKLDPQENHSIMHTHFMEKIISLNKTNKTNKNKILLNRN